MKINNISINENINNQSKKLKKINNTSNNISKVNLIKKQIEEGKYKINLEVTAKKMAKILLN